MFILLTNDDGIGASGIRALCHELKEIAEIAIVAPDSEKSATSQSITVHSPIRVDEYCMIEYPSLPAWRIGGTPTDCVKIALESLLTAQPDFIVSGINHGPNLGTDVLYSGTVSAAIEGVLHGIPSVAVSLDTWNAADFGPAAKYIRNLIENLSKHKLPPNTLLNVNIPSLPTTEFAGVAVTKLGLRQYENTFDKRQDPRGKTYYWMGGNIVDTDNDCDTDVYAVKNRFISVTPIHFDLTNYAIMDDVRSWNL